MTSPFASPQASPFAHPMQTMAAPAAQPRTWGNLGEAPHQQQGLNWSSWFGGGPQSFGGGQMGQGQGQPPWSPWFNQGQMPNFSGMFGNFSQPHNNSTQPGQSNVPPPVDASPRLDVNRENPSTSVSPETSQPAAGPSKHDLLMALLSGKTLVPSATGGGFAVHDDSVR